MVEKIEKTTLCPPWIKSILGPLWITWKYNRLTFDAFHLLEDKNRGQAVFVRETNRGITYVTYIDFHMIFGLQDCKYYVKNIICEVIYFEIVIFKVGCIGPRTTKMFIFGQMYCSKYIIVHILFGNLCKFECIQKIVQYSLKLIYVFGIIESGWN